MAGKPAAAQLHPIFEAALSAVIPPQDEAPNWRIAAYIRALQAHDWAFEFADDSRAWNRGRVERDHLRAEREAIDPDAAIWNTHCPEQYRITPVIPVGEATELVAADSEGGEL